MSRFLLRNASHLVDYPTFHYIWQQRPANPYQVAAFNASKQHWLLNFIFLNMLFNIASHRIGGINGFNSSHVDDRNLKQQLESNFKTISLLQFVEMIPSMPGNETAVLAKKLPQSNLITRHVAEYLNGPDLHAMSLVTFGLFGRQKKRRLL